VILSKYAANQQEWYFALTDEEKVVVLQFDNSVDKTCSRTTDAAVSAGWHFVVYTNTGTGGATSMNTGLLYVDGVVVASTAGNDAAYVAMENGTSAVTVCSDGGNFMQGDAGMLFVTREALSAVNIWRMYIKTRGYYNK
jgi:hypothetical protein